MRYAVTGHRPTKLFRDNPYSLDNYNKLLAFAKELLQNADPNKVTILTGMALGWDMAIAEACVLKGIPFEAYVPCKDQHKVWKSQFFQAKYLEIISHAKEIHLLSEKYTRDCMQKRNEAMADAADCLLALWDGSSGGTGNMVQYWTTKYPEKKWFNYWRRWTTC
jgi:uncharacterized phage-like protein YoqJ